MKIGLRISLVIGVFFSLGVQGQDISAEQNYAACSPAVVMVQTVFSATVYVNKVEMNEKRFNRLVDSVRRLDTSGSMLSAEDKLDIVVKALYNSPSRFLSAIPQYFRQKHRINSSGTGFFVTGDGYLITNAHIIDRDSAFIQKKFTMSTFQEVTDENIKALESSWAMTLNDEQRSLLNNAYSVIYSQVSNMFLFDLQREIFVQVKVDGNHNRQDGVTTRRMPARVIIKGAPMPGKDVALLKVDSVDQLPTLKLSKESLARIGEEVYVYGFPDPVTSNAYLARENNIEPTLTAGIVSAIKKSIGGWPVIQMDAVITHGSSGSPVCNAKGEVIGLATFGSLEQTTGSLASGYNFAIPVSQIRGFMDTAGVESKMSQASLVYNKALSLFYDEYYSRALKRFAGVKRINGEYPQLNFFIKEASTKLAEGTDKETLRRRNIYRGLAVTLIAGCLLIYYRRQRKKRITRLN